MRKRIGGIVLAAALCGVTATPAAAQVDVVSGPVCSAFLVGADLGASDSCYYHQSTTQYATVTVVTDGTVTATTRCNDGGYVRTSTRTFTSSGVQTGGWSNYAVGQCTLTITSGFPGTSAVATVTPMVNTNPVP